MKPLAIIFTLLFTFQITAQDPILQKENKALESVATTITRAYDDQLELDAKQYVLFEGKVEEFLIREEKIHKEFKRKNRLDQLYKLRKAESLEMRNILTQPQFDLYVRIKPQIQPLAKIEVDDK